MPLTPTFAEILRTAVETAGEQIHTALPARVIRFDAGAQTVDVEPAIKVPYVGEDEEVEWEELPSVLSVPVCFPRGGGYFVSVPLVPGDFVWLMVTSADISRWRNVGGTKAEGESVARHALGSAFAMPGAFPIASKLSDPSGDELRLGRDGNEPQIRVMSGEIRLGKTASDFVALASLVQGALDTIVEKFDAHTHLTAGVGSPVPPAPAQQIGTLGPVAASIVKAK